MPNVFQIKDAAERRAALLNKKEDVDSTPDEPDGLLQFTHKVGGGSRMIVTGAYAERLQLCVYTMAKAMSELVERIKDSGTAGSSNSGHIDEQIQFPRAPRCTPRRLRESTDFGGLQ